MNDDLKFLRETIAIAQESRESGNHPFGAVLIGPEGETLIRGGNSYSTDKGVGHAELNVARTAAARFDPKFLEKCTLYTSVEPCCMCAGACYWAGIGTVVFGMTEKRLFELIGNNAKNLTFNLPCEVVFNAGQRKVKTRGPFTDIEDEVALGHKDFW